MQPCLAYFGDPDDLLAGHRLVEECFVALVHGAQVVRCAVIADPVPQRLPIANEIVPPVTTGFGFDQPVTCGHAFLLARRVTLAHPRFQLTEN